MKNSILLFFALIQPSLFARLATPEEAHFRKKSTINLFVDSSGMYTEDLLNETTILTEAARQNCTSIKLDYLSDSEDFSFKEAKVLHANGKVDVIDTQALSQEPNPGDNLTIDDTMFITIPIPNVNVGSTIHLHTLKKQKKQAFPGVFSFGWELSGKLASQGTEMNITSEIPLLYKIRHPEIFEVSEEKNENPVSYHYRFRLKEDHYHEVIFERQGSSIEPDGAAIEVVSAKIEDAFLSVSQAIESELDRKITEPIFVQTLLKAKRKKYFEDKINVLIEALHNKEFTYYLDYRQTERRQFSRTFQEIFRDRKADCKDFALLMTKWLRELGYKETYPANVYSGNFDVMPWFWNHPVTTHRIVYCKAHGKEWWIDPTLPFSTGSMIPSSLINRQALLLKKSGNEIKTIPLPKPDETIYFSKVTSHKESPQVFHRIYEERLLKRAAINTHSNFYGVSPSTVQSYLQERFSQNLPAQTLALDFSPIKDRRVRDLFGSGMLAYEPAVMYQASSLEKFLPLVKVPKEAEKFMHIVHVQSSGIDVLCRTDFSSYVLGYYVGDPRIEISEETFKSVSLHKLPEGVKVDTPWFSFERTFEMKGDDLTLREQATFKRDRITNKELKSEEFSSAVKKITTGCFEFSWKAMSHV